MDGTVRTHTYTFDLPDGVSISFPISLDPLSHALTTCPLSPPEWSRLRYHQCGPCTLKEDEHPYCPVALHIAELVTAFKDIRSHARCVVSCVSEERTVIKNTTVQDGLASILGLLMATSGCPVLGFFRPMARCHLPFSTVDESIFRVVAMYMLRQYYRKKAVPESDPLDEIRARYSLVKQVNVGLMDRIRHVSALDADKNAIVTLASLAEILEMEIDTNLESLQHLFLDG